MNGNGVKRRPRRTDDASLKVSLEKWIRDRRETGHGVDEDVKAAQIARRIVVSYGGEPALREFIRMLEDGKPGTEIAARFQVTRQRANQWKDAIGIETTRYAVRPILRRLIGTETSAA